jgi:hypothetical protein
MIPETGTLKELNLQPGDVVECLRDGYEGLMWTCYDDHHIGYGGRRVVYEGKSPTGRFGWLPAYRGDGDWKFRIVSRAADTPKLWRDMTPEEKGALLLAEHEGRVIQYYNQEGHWSSLTVRPVWFEDGAYRIRPEPKRETVTLYAGHDGLPPVPIGTIDLTDGKLDLGSAKIEPIGGRE